MNIIVRFKLWNAKRKRLIGIRKQIELGASVLELMYSFFSSLRNFIYCDPLEIIILYLSPISSSVIRILSPPTPKDITPLAVCPQILHQKVVIMAKMMLTTTSMCCSIRTTTTC